MTSPVATMSTTGPSVRLNEETDDSSITGFEVVAARRALALLKRRLGRERLLELLRDEVAAGTTFLRTNVERSAGQQITGATRLRARGIGANAFAGWLSTAFGREDVLLAAHPEHYSIHAGGGRVNIVETLGDHVCSFFMREWDESATPEPTPASEDDGYGPPARRSHLVLEDGTVVGSIANWFRDEEDGFTLRLSVTLPSTCGPEVVEHHLQHFAVEYRNWILAAAAELS
ncbi:hypothetical protein [uncultured Friedmanniella sp.]|uniref:hypothetical protein n=1 Tax=uncultured Friedmanniella sp. TaxID=335381 RepID=UPI0035C976E6